MRKDRHVSVPRKRRGGFTEDRADRGPDRDHFSFDIRRARVTPCRRDERRIEGVARGVNSPSCLGVSEIDRGAKPASLYRKIKDQDGVTEGSVWWMLDPAMDALLGVTREVKPAP